jgi:hypothetical protein
MSQRVEADPPVDKRQRVVAPPTVVKKQPASPTVAKKQPVSPEVVKKQPSPPTVFKKQQAALSVIKKQRVEASPPSVFVKKPAFAHPPVAKTEKVDIDLTDLKSQIITEIEAKMSKPSSQSALEILKRAHQNQKEFLEKQQKINFELGMTIEILEKDGGSEFKR